MFTLIAKTTPIFKQGLRFSAATNEEGPVQNIGPALRKLWLVDYF